jgi:hypothetical protein
MRLPQDYRVSVPLLSACFRNTSATYKFYWFLSIIEAVEEGQEKIEKRELFARMIANAWYTVNYFHVSFGKQDKFQQAIDFLKELEEINIDERKKVIVERLLNSSKKETQKQLQHFDNQVPHWFLSPWIKSDSKKEIMLLSQENFNYPPYALYADCILIQPDWKDYFLRNAGMLKDFCYWNLSQFLQSRNPNVQGISNKLLRPEKRGSLSYHKKDFWDLVMDELGFVECIYTEKKLVKGNYAVEHFVPFQYVVHDLMWNLIPADPGFNSSKGDRLPQLEKYFDDFYFLQKEAVHIVRKVKPNNRFLEEYLTVFPDLNIDKERYYDCIQPMLTIAQNNGFQYMKPFEK